MNLINRHDKCVGLTILRWGKWLVELWRCPVGSRVEPHIHPMQDSTLVILRGAAILGKEDREIHVAGASRMVYYIAATTPHWFRCVTRPLWFLNISYTHSAKPESAAVNFQHIPL